jgi:peroxiredoxin
LRAGGRLPAFSLRDLDGNRQTLKQYAGQLLVLHFWASWCPYCRGESPKLTELSEQWAARGVRVLTVSLDEDVSKLTSFLRSRPLPYPVVAAGASGDQLAARYEISGIPVTYIVATDGRIATRLDGRSDIIGAVRQALATAVPSEI